MISIITGIKKAKARSILNLLIALITVTAICVCSGSTAITQGARGGGMQTQPPSSDCQPK